MGYIDIHTHFNTHLNYDFKSNIYLFNQSLDDKELSRSGGHFKYKSVGIHPWSLSNDNENSEIYKIKILQIEQLLIEKKIFALGEVGLDRCIKTDLDFQKEIFTQQLQLNEKFKRPVIIHSVKSYSDILMIKKNFIDQLWIIHGFNENREVALQLIKANCYLSFGARLYDSRSRAYKTFKEIPLSSVFLETDEQTDYTIQNIYQKALELTSIKLENLQKILYDNFNHLR